ncbi:hypothetical protein [Acidovorax sp.]|uniref:hypothetical protein n=1 Tax=Acidovorax sp. TaxID=1872122 RepID=UPI0026322BD4|nr:hypothetical protein [Acidovorax sp.]
MPKASKKKIKRRPFRKTLDQSKPRSQLLTGKLTANTHNERISYVRRTLSPDANGNYLIGPKNSYLLSSAAVRHIFDGDLADQVVRNPGVPTVVQKILKGGLHSFLGWKNLNNQRPEVVHGAIYRSDRHQFWYFARELQNGVVLLKIPRTLFQSNAAKLTLSADIYFKSGYLWKTLFPEYMSRDDVISAIDESLFHPDAEESEEGILVGYALLDDPLKALKVRVQVTGFQINSAFPTWGQPSTGNNGKPYIHSDAIAFSLAASTIFFGDEEKFFSIAQNGNFRTPLTSLATLRVATPSIFSRRPIFDSTSRDLEVRDTWNLQRKIMAETASHLELEAVKSYITDDRLLKDPFPLLIEAYGEDYRDFSREADFYSLTSLYQNQLDGFKFLAEFDSHHSTKHAKDYFLLYLRSRFLRFGGHEVWESKRMHVAIIESVISSDDSVVAWEYIKALATSPSRMAAYSDINFNPYADGDIAVVGVSEPNVRAKPQHLYRFAANNSGLNYILYMSLKEREKLCSASLSVYFKHFNEFVADQVGYADVRELTSFAWYAKDVVGLLRRDISGVDRDAIREIAHDYYRVMQLAQVAVLVDNGEIINGGRSLEFDDHPYSAYWLYTKIKHQRDWLIIQVSEFFHHFGLLCSDIGDAKLQAFCESRADAFRKEIIPSPKSVPANYRRWRNIRNNSHGRLQADSLLKLWFPDGKSRD